MTQLNQTLLPTMRDLVRVDALPPALGFLEAPLGDILDRLFYDNLIFHKSVNGDSAHYSLDLIIKRNLTLLSIPGTGISLVLNPPPPTGAGTGALFSVTFEYEWILRRYIRGAQLATFSWDVRGFLDLLCNIFGITRDELTQEAVTVFIPAAPGQSPAQTFVDNYNAKYTPPIVYNADPSLGVEIADVLSQIPPGRDVVGILVDDYLDNAFDKLKLLIAKWVGPLDEANLRRIVIPRFRASLDKVSLGLTLPRSVFVPLEANNDPRPEPAQSMVRLNGGSFEVDSEKGFLFRRDLSFSFDRSEILGTGFIIELEGIKLDLSEKVNIPEADEDGRPVDFRGVYVQSAKIDFPQFWNHSGGSGRLNARNLLIGTGGLSGTIGLEAVNGTDPAPLINVAFGGGFRATLDAFSMTFKQNAITDSRIKGSLTIPGFKDATGTKDATIDIDVHIAGDGDFKVTASNAVGVRIGIPQVFHFDVTSATIGRKANRFFFAIGGKLGFEAEVGKFLPDEVEIRKLLVWDDGKIELEGGKITLPRAISLKAGPVNLSVTAIGFGAHEQEHKGHLRQYKYFTFDGGVNVDPGGVDVSGNGIAFYYTVDNDPSQGRDPHRFLRIQSIAVDLVIPGSATKDSAVVLLKGYLSMREAKPPSTGTEYAGSIAITLPKLKMGAAAAMRLNPSVPAFIIDVGLEMSTPILLGSTGLGIWGFRGLLGLRYVATKNAAALTDADPWWKYYKAKIADDFREGIQVSKFEQIPGFSLGAGVSLATAADKGKTFSSKIFFLLSLPEVFLLQGQGQILKGLIGLNDPNDPPFFALISITKSSVETAFGVKYGIPDDEDPAKRGGIATVNGVIEMGFFWGSSVSWYVNIGRDEPVSDRILVRLLSIIDAYFYFMISGNGIRAGAGASYHLSKKFGPLRAEVHAYLDTAGRLSVRPKQIGASMRIGGSVDLTIFGFGFGISVAASLAAEGTKPFTVTGSFEVCVRVLRKDRCARFELTWIFNQDLDQSETRLLAEDLKESGKALNIHTHETYELWTGAQLPAPSDLWAHMIPMDSYIDLAFLKGVKPSAPVIKAFGGNTMGSEYIEYVAPQRGKNDRVRHEYSLEAVEILYHDGVDWKPYDIYGAATPAQLVPFITSNPATLKQGFWQYQDANRHNKLRILAQSPLTYLSQGTGDAVVEDSGITVESIFCAPEPIAETCTAFDDYPPLVKQWLPIEEKREYLHRNLQFRVVGRDGHVVIQPEGPHTRALRVEGGGAIELFLLEPAVSVRLKIKTSTANAVASFYRREPAADGYAWVLVTRKQIARDQLVEVHYEDLHEPVEKVVIEPGVCTVDVPLKCDAVVTKEARDLERFLDALVRRGELLNPAAELYSRDLHGWDGVFFNTSLYTGPLDPAYVRFEMTSFNDTELRGRITDWKGFVCAIQLTLVEGASALEWKRLERLYDLRPDPFSPRVAGTNTIFLIDGDVVTAQGQRRHVVLRGTSCYPIFHCKRAGATNPPTKPAVALGELLTLLADRNALIQPRVRLNAAEVAAFDRAFGASGASSRKVSLTTTTQFVDTVSLTFGDPAAPKLGGQVLLSTAISRHEFTVDQVVGLSGFRPDPAFSGSGPMPGFLIDARLRERGMESTTTLRGIAPFSVTAVITVPTNTETLGTARATFSSGSSVTDCVLHLYEVCVLDYPSAAFNETLPAQSSVDAEVASVVHAFQGSIQPLWGPGTAYAIRVSTKDELFRESGSDAIRTYVNEAFYGFRTAGPIGHYHRYRDANGQEATRADYAALEALGREDEFKLAGLLHYIDFAKTYPDAGGQLINAKPLFYDSPRLRLFYLQTYVARMLCGWAPWGGLEAANAVFEVVVKDPAPDPNVADPGAVEATWQLSPLPLVSHDVTVLNNMITYGKPCATVSVIEPTWLASEFPLESQNLQPLKLYTAIFNLRFKKQSESQFVQRELLRYPFQTSAYASLADQVDSYKLRVDPDDGTVLEAAVFEAGRAFTAAELAVVQNVLADTLAADDPLRQTFADPYDRLIGALQLEAMHPAAGTEFNIVRDTVTKSILGILLCNPEPFNDPKLPPGVVAATIRMSVNGGDPALYRAVFAKDLARVFLTNADHSMSVPGGATLDFTFDYREWDGSTYELVQTASAQVVLP